MYPEDRSQDPSGGPNPPSRAAPQFFLGLILLLVAGLPYLATLNYGFVYDDDVQILADPAVQNWHSVPRYFTQPISFFTNTRSVRYYRPLFFVWSRLNYFLWGPEARGWHLANIVLHAFVTLLAFAVLRRYFSDPRWAFGGALLFAVHPIHTETVAWASGSTDAVMSLFLLGSLLLWMKAVETSSVRSRCFSLLLFGMALLSKETAIVLPVIVFLHALLQFPRTKFSFRGALRQALPYVAIALAYSLLRVFIFRGTAATPAWLSVGEALLTVPYLVSKYAFHLARPWDLSIFYAPVFITRPSFTTFWLPLVCLLLTLTLLCLSLGKSRSRYVIAASWFILPLGPVLYVRLFQADDFFHDRYLYLPVLAVSVLMGILLEFVARRQWVVAGIPGWMPLLVAVTLAFSVLTAREARPWRNNLLLYQQAVRVSPSSPMARNNLATEYAKQGAYAQATPLLESVLHDRPQMWLANYNLGYVNYKLTNLDLAQEFLRRAIQIDPTDPDQYFYLGLTYFKRGQLPEAGEQVRLAIARNPRGNAYHLTLALIELQMGNPSAARQELDEEVRANPGNQAAAARVQAAIH